MFHFLVHLFSFTAALSLNDFMSTKALYSPLPAAPAPPACEARALTMVLRHGARNPSRTDLDLLTELQADLAAAPLGNATLRAELQRWRVPWPRDEAGLLTDVGADEHYRIGVRLRQRFAGLFQRPYTPKRYRFSSTQISRAARSAQALAFGMFEGDGIVGGPANRSFLPVFVESVAAKDDFLLRFFKLCPAYARFEEQCCDGKAAFLDRVLAPLAAELSRTLAPINASVDDVLAVYTACQFEHASRAPPLFCPLLSPAALAALEFVDDVERERAGARGNPTHDCAADLVRAMRDTLLACANANGTCDTRVALWFAHAETIIPLSSALRLFETRPLLHWNASVPPPTELSSWPVSRVSPFAANVGFVLYECANNATPDARWMVQALHNEGAIAMPGGNDTVPLAQWLSPAMYGNLLAVNTTTLCYAKPADNSSRHDRNTDDDVLDATGVVVVSCVAAAGLVICSAAAYCATSARNRSIRSEKSGKFQTSYSSEKEAAALSSRFLDINAPQSVRRRRSNGVRDAAVVAGDADDVDDDEIQVSAVPDDQKRVAITEGIRDFMSD